jgi:predicted ATPase/class 3 adenylate cyclase
MTALPQGTVTFLFTDIEGSTRLLHELGDDYAAALEEHRRILREAFARHGGVEVDTQGDAFFVVFAKASDALAAARDGQAALRRGPVRVRMGLHTGEPIVAGGGYVGIDVHRAARIAAAGHGGQILVSQTTRDLAADNGLRDLGEHRLKDLAAPERIYQLGDGEFPPLKSLDNTNLPLPAQPLIGRKKELADVLEAFRAGTRLLTITGPGGIGKTRFALAAATELIDDFPDGVSWVGLAPVRDPTIVLPTMASAVGAKGDLVDALKGKRRLLLLDNFEHVVEAAREVAGLQQTCADVALLVTSREPLHIDGEREYALAPLPEAPAVELFRQRAEAIAPGFDADYRVLVEVCDRLDSLPLAIELAAARTKALSVAELLDRLDQRLPLLTSRRRDVDERQRTLRATIEWSHDLLSDDDKELFARVSVFAGSFDVVTAEQVCEADVDALESLVDKSLLRTTPDRRFFMLETIREFAANALASHPDADDVAAGHAEYFLRLAEEAAPHLTGSLDQAVWLGRLERELDNLRVALSFCREHNEYQQGFRLAVALWEFWWMHGSVREGRGHLLHALQSAGVPDTSVGVNALEGACYLSYLDGDERDARAWSDRLMQLAERLGDDYSLARAWHMRALLARDDDERVRLETCAIELAGDDPYVRHAVESLGLVALRRGDLDVARRYFERVIAIADRARDRRMVSGALILLSVVSAEFGRYDEAVRNLRAGTEEARRIGDRTTFVWQRAWIVTSVVLTARGSPGDACRVLGAAERLREDEGSRLGGFTEEFQERAVTKIRAVSSTEEIERAWQEGRKLASREYLEETLGRLD